MKEFEHESTIKEFKKLMKQAFPHKMHPRQYGDLLTVFLAGYAQCDTDYKNALKSFQDYEATHLFMNELAKDNIDRAQFTIDCMVKDDWSHPQFTQEQHQ